MEKNNKNSYYVSSNLIVYLWQNKILFFIIGIAAIIISSIYAFSITPKYKSNVVLFPVSQASVSGSLLTESAFATNDILRFGGEQESEQMMQILQSAEVRNRIVKKYNLASHYKLDSASRSFNYKLYSAYNSNIKFRRTDLMSIVIEVLDTDPDTAALIANDIAEFIDTVMNHIVHERAIKALYLVEKEYNQLCSETGQLQDSLRKIREMGVLNYEAQSQALSNAYATAIKDGNSAAAKQIEKKISILAKYGGTYESINNTLKSNNERLKVLASKYGQAKVDAEQDLPNKYIVEKAHSSDHKAYPVRWIIVVVSTLSTLFFAIMVLLIRDTIKHYNKD